MLFPDLPKNRIKLLFSNFVIGFSLWRVQQRISKGFEIFEFYANNQWDFNNDGSLEARRLMNDTEKQMFKVDGVGLDLEDYFYHCTHAARLYILKETDDTLPAARRHMKM